MAYTRTFEGYAPPNRYDGLPFTKANIRESASIAGTYATIEVIALSPADTDPTNPASRNFTTAAATLSDGWYIIQWEDALGSTFDADPIQYNADYTPDLVSPLPGDLLTLDEYKLAEHIDLNDATNDDSIEQMISMVSAAVRRLTDRDFGIAPATATRTYDYNGGGIVNINDATSVSEVALDGVVLAERQYRAQPQNDEVYFYIDVYEEPSRYGSAEMNFGINLGGTYGDPRYAANSQVEVTALFGWSVVPPDVKLAAIEMIRSSLELPKDELVSESIAEYSYSNGNQEMRSGFWPRKAVDLLQPYRRINL